MLTRIARPLYTTDTMTPSRDKTCLSHRRPSPTSLLPIHNLTPSHHHNPTTTTSRA